jgi:hypothetical protein
MQQAVLREGDDLAFKAVTILRQRKLQMFQAF